MTVAAHSFQEFVVQSTLDAAGLIAGAAKLRPLAPPLPRPQPRLSLPGAGTAASVAGSPRVHAAWLSRWLHAAAGVHRVDVGPQIQWAHHRAVPSARCLFPAQVIVLVPGGMNSDLPAGTYRYDALHHQLEVQTDAARQQLEAALCADLTDVALIAAVTMDLSRVQGKYGLFGYRLALIEAGLQAAALAMTAEVEGWSVALGWDFPDAAVGHALDLPAHERAAALLLLSRTPLPALPRYASAPPESTSPSDLLDLDRFTHLDRATRPGPRGPVAAACHPRTLARELWALLSRRHSGDVVFAPAPEPIGASTVSQWLQDMALDYPLFDPDAAVLPQLHALIGQPGPQLTQLCWQGGALSEGPGVDKIQLSAAQPDMLLAEMPLTVYLTAGWPDGPPRRYRHLMLDLGVRAMRLLLLATRHGWAGRLSCSYQATAVQRALALAPQTVPFLQICLGREPVARWAQQRYRLALRH